MFPIMLDISNLKIALVGGGDSALRRLKMLDEAGAKDIKIFADNFGREFWNKAGERITTRMPNEEEIKNFSVITVVDVSKEKATTIAKLARKHGVIVNVEDDRSHCDFFFPTVVRHGDLNIAVSTCGKSPTLARRIRDVIGKIFYGVWADRVEEMALKKRQWKDIGLNAQEINDMSNKYIDEQGWLDYEELAKEKESA